MIKVFLSLPMPYNKCKRCDNEFYAKPFWIKQGKAKYCSTICHHESMKNGKVVKCFICNKDTYKTSKELKSSKSKKYFCSKSCQTIWRNTMVYIGSRHPNWTGGRNVNYRKILTRAKVAAVCGICNARDERVLAVHHKDHNHKNNKILNLLWLCHNCHFLVHHHESERQKINF